MAFSSVITRTSALTVNLILALAIAYTVRPAPSLQRQPRNPPSLQASSQLEAAVAAAEAEAKSEAEAAEVARAATEAAEAEARRIGLQLIAAAEEDATKSDLLALYRGRLEDGAQAAAQQLQFWSTQQSRQLAIALALYRGRLEDGQKAAAQLRVWSARRSRQQYFRFAE